MLLRVQSLVHKSRFTAISASVQQSMNPRWKADRPYGHVIGQRKGNYVQMDLNRGHKNNLLTPLMIQELHRFFKSYEIDDIIQMIWLQSSNSEVFSRGTDLRYILNRVQNDRYDEAQNYLQQIQGCAHLFASYNKPTLGYLRGEVSGSAASMISTMPFIIADVNARWWVNDVFYGYIPHGGASYTLSRLPREIGVYLALTGQVVGYRDIQTLNMANYQLVGDVGDIQEFLQEVIQNGVTAGHTNEVYGNMFQWWRRQYLEGQEQYLKRIEFELQQRTQNPDLDLAEDGRSVLAEVLYKHELVKDQNLDIWKNPGIQQNIQNYLQYYEDNVLNILQSQNYIERGAQLNTIFENPAIVRCFSANTVEEILDRLKSEGSEWSMGVIKKLEMRSPLLMKLTLSLIRKAQSSTWAQCLQQEYLVGVRVMKHPDFALGVQRIGNYQLKQNMQKWQHSNLNQVSDEEVQGYFVQDDNYKLQIDVVDNSFHPVKDFYKRYPDNVRKFLNEENLYGNGAARQNQEFDVLAFLKNNNLPYDDESVSVADIRNVIMGAEMRVNQLETKLNRLFDLCGSYDNLRVYHNQRTDYIEKQFQDSQDIQQLIDESVIQIFDIQFQERVNAYRHIADVANFKNKTDFFSDTRNIILNKQLTTDEPNGLHKWYDPTRMLYFPDDDCKNFIVTYNKSLDDKTLFKKLYDKLQHSNNKNKGKSDYWRYQICGFDPEGQDPFDRLHVQYDILYGDPKLQFDQTQYQKKLLKAGQQSQGIQKYLKSNSTEKIQKVLLETQKLTDSEIANNIHSLTKIERKNKLDANQKSLEQFENIIQSTKQEMQKLSFQSKLIQLADLSADGRINYDQQTINNRFLYFIQSEEKLQELMNPILKQNQNASIQSIQKRYQNILFQLYTIKIKRFIDDSQRIVHLEQNLLDKYLHQQVEDDLNKLIEPNIFFSFAYFLLQDLDGIYQALYKIAERTPKYDKDYNTQIERNLNALLNIKIQKAEEIQLIIQYLNQILKTAATLFEVYKDNITFSAEKQLFATIRFNENKRIQLQQHQKNTSITNSNDFINKSITLANKLNKNKPLWSRDTLFHYIENEQSGFDDTMNQEYSRRLQDELDDWRKGVFDYHTTIYEKRAWYILRQQKNKQNLREWVPGMQHYLLRLDNATAKSQRNTQLLTPVELQKQLDELEKISSIFNVTNNLPLKDWFKNKILQALKQLFNLRKKYEMMDQMTLHHFDQELIQLIQSNQFKNTLLRSLDKEMDDLGEIARALQIKSNTIRDREMDQFQSQVQEQKLPNNIPLLMTAAVAPKYFSKETQKMQMLPTEAQIEIEVGQPDHPLKRGRNIRDQKQIESKDEIMARLRKASQTIQKQTEPAIVSMYQQDILASKIHYELKYMTERIILSNQIKPTQPPEP